MESTAGDLRERIPQTRHEAQQVEKALARELEKLSMKERENILLDVHGAAKNTVDEATIALKQKELDQELSLLEGKEAYDRAWAQDRRYVEDQSFRLQFLRAEEYDARKAAQLLVSHFDVKQELFVRGTNEEITLVRTITWDDLDEQDRLIVLTGFIQVGSKRDVAGRTTIFITSAAMQPSMKKESLCRAYWYVLMSALQSDPEMQKKGAVAVVINFRDFISPMDTLRGLMRAHVCMPMATCAVHYGYRNPALHTAVVGFQLLLYTQAARQSHRFRFHFGSLEDIAFELQTFGIPMDSCPIKTTHSGLTIAWHLEWLKTIQKLERMKKEEQKIKESQEEASAKSFTDLADEGTCIIPRRFDVLLGKSRMAREHPGTLRCHHLVRTQWDAYEKASRQDKTNVADQVLSSILHSEGRFLQWKNDSSEQGGSWVVIQHDVARDRISHMFRRLREVGQGKRNWYLGNNSGATKGRSSNKASETVASSQSNTSLPMKKSLSLISQGEAPVQPRLKQRKTAMM